MEPMQQSSMGVDSDDKISDDPDTLTPGDSADHTVSNNNLTASGPSPQKKLKEGHGSREG